MPVQYVIIVSGRPGVGKTHLAARLARRYALPLIAKDAIKESLFDTLGTGDARWSRRLSDAAFATLFVVAGEVLEAHGSVLLEGNFRVQEHEDPMRALLKRRQCEFIQVLCRLPDAERRERLERRATRNERHPGHLDRLFMRRASDRSERADEFLDLPGGRIEHDGIDADTAWGRVARELDSLLLVQAGQS